MTLEALKDFDNFYYYGQGDLKDEIKSDVYQVAIQNIRSLYYNRANDSAGIDQYINTPNTIAQTILIPYNVVSALSSRNLYVGNGQNNTKDRRVAVSQNYIRVKNSENFIEVALYYIPLVDTKGAESATIKILT